MAVDVEPIVDLDVGPRRQIIFVSMATTLVSRSTPRSYRCGLIVCWIRITSAARSAGCFARGSRCKVNDGVKVNVAVDVKGRVKVIVEDKVNSCD